MTTYGPNNLPHAPKPENTNQIPGFRWGVPVQDTQELRVLLLRLGWSALPGVPQVWTKLINKWRDAKLLLGPNSLEICLHLPPTKAVTGMYLDYLFYVGVEMGTLLTLLQTLPAFAKSLSPGPAQHNLAAPFLRPAQEVSELLKAAREAAGLDPDSEDGDSEDDEDDEEEEGED